jgi:hypothetical protein
LSEVWVAVENTAGADVEFRLFPDDTDWPHAGSFAVGGGEGTVAVVGAVSGGALLYQQCDGTVAECAIAPGVAGSKWLAAPEAVVTAGGSHPYVALDLETEVAFVAFEKSSTGQVMVAWRCPGPPATWTGPVVVDTVSGVDELAIANGHSWAPIAIHPGHVGGANVDVAYVSDHDLASGTPTQVFLASAPVADFSCP